jgi:hypothetical protein
VYTCTTCMCVWYTAQQLLLLILQWINISTTHYGNMYIHAPFRCTGYRCCTTGYAAVACIMCTTQLFPPSWRHNLLQNTTTTGCTTTFQCCSDSRFEQFPNTFVRQGRTFKHLVIHCTNSFRHCIGLSSVIVWSMISPD